MYKSWRWIALVLLASSWPQLGCGLLPIGKSVEDPRPPQAQVSAFRPEPTATEIALNNADALMKAGQTNEAIAAYEQIRLTDRSSAWYATRKLALLHYLSNDMKGAEKEYLALLEQNQNDVEVLFKLGSIRYGQGNWESAQGYFWRAVEHSQQQDQNFVHAQMGLAWCLGQRDDYDGCVKEFSKVISPAEAYVQLSKVLTYQSKPHDAIRALEMAVTLDKNNTKAREALAQLRATAPTVGASPASAIAQQAMPTDKKSLPGAAELEPLLAQEIDAGMNRALSQRPQLPAYPALDLTEGTPRQWESSAKK